MDADRVEIVGSETMEKKSDDELRQIIGETPKAIKVVQEFLLVGIVFVPAVLAAIGTDLALYTYLYLFVGGSFLESSHCNLPRPPGCWFGIPNWHILPHIIVTGTVGFLGGVAMLAKLPLSRNEILEYVALAVLIGVVLGLGLTLFIGIVPK